MSSRSSSSEEELSPDHVLVKKHYDRVCDALNRPTLCAKLKKTTFETLYHHGHLDVRAGFYDGDNWAVLHHNVRKVWAEMTAVVYYVFAASVVDASPSQNDDQEEQAIWNKSAHFKAFQDIYTTIHKSLQSSSRHISVSTRYTERDTVEHLIRAFTAMCGMDDDARRQYLRAVRTRLESALARKGTSCVRVQEIFVLKYDGARSSADPVSHTPSSTHRASHSDDYDATTHQVWTQAQQVWTQALSVVRPVVKNIDANGALPHKEWTDAYVVSICEALLGRGADAPPPPHITAVLATLIHRVQAPEAAGFPHGPDTPEDLRAHALSREIWRAWPTSAGVASEMAETLLEARNRQEAIARITHQATIDVKDRSMPLFLRRACADAFYGCIAHVKDDTKALQALLQWRDERIARLAARLRRGAA